MVFGWIKRLKKKQTLEQAQQALEETNERTNEQTHDSTETASTEPVELHKESLKLGLAAGYTGRSIHDINESLNRIETLLPTKDWLLIQLEKHFSQHEENEQKRIDIVLKALESIYKLSLNIPEPARSEIQAEVENVKTKLTTSIRMNELIELVKQHGEISYLDGSTKLGLSSSGFRSLVSDTKKRTSEIVTIDHGDKKKKFLRFTGKSSGSSA